MWVEQTVDALAGQKFSPLAVALDMGLANTGCGLFDALAQGGQQILVMILVFAESFGPGIDLRFNLAHRGHRNSRTNPNVWGGRVAKNGRRI